MYADEQIVSCPANGRPAPAIAGVERVDQEWHCSPERHHELLVDITGIKPTAELDLQDFATITARLEGYVERERRRQTQMEQDTVQPTDSSAANGGLLSWFLARLTDIRHLLLPESAENSAESDGSTAAENPEYAVETVYHLSRVFRAATDAQRREVETRTAA